mmetsp:Transcript_44929/g.104755  ORF Transcript_44929/g.104755 Transcript_44929/m.104755 type:complete len:500 (-) Transcript_44929:356-1855(-)
MTSLPSVSRGQAAAASRGSVAALPGRRSILPPIEGASTISPTRGATRERRESVPLPPEGDAGLVRRVSITATSAELSKDNIAGTLSAMKLFKDLDPAVLQMIPEIVTSIICQAGTVLFKQGDPPGSCYVVITGSVGVFALSEEELSVHPAQGPNRLVALPQTETDFMQSFLPGQKTVDGFSRYHEDTNLGNRLSRLGPGNVVGELALMNDQPRLASAQCLEDTEVFVIRRHDFDNVLKEEMVKKGDEKLRFLMRHLPGMKEVPVPKPGGKPHASYVFKHAKFARGHTFLVQGKVAEPHIWAVYKGAVEFKRAEVLSLEKLGERSTAQLRSRPLSALKQGGMKKTRSQPRMHGIGRDGNVAAEANDSNPNGVMSRRGVLVVGGVFGSLPFPAPEPFTVRVTSPMCEVFYMSSADFPKIPRKLLDVLQEYIASSTTWRLSCHQRSTDFRKHGGEKHGGPKQDDAEVAEWQSQTDGSELIEECREVRKSHFEDFQKAAFAGT